MADFPSSLVPSVTQGYSFDAPANVLTQPVQGGVPLMMLDYASGPVTFNIGLVMTPSDLQTFQEFIVNDINNGAGEFNINLDSGYGVATHNVVIDMDSLNIDGSRAPIWTASFTVIKDLSIPPVIADGFDSSKCDVSTSVSADKKYITSANSGGTCLAVNPLVRDTYWEVKGTGAIGTIYMGVAQATGNYAPRLDGMPDGAEIEYSSGWRVRGFDNIPYYPGWALNVNLVISVRYEVATRTLYMSQDGVTWENLGAHSMGVAYYAAASIFNGESHGAFIHEDCIRTVPSGYSTYDNDYTAP